MNLALRKTALYDADVKDAFTYGIQQFGVQVASAFRVKLDEIESLIESFPEIGAIVPLSVGYEIRRVLVGPYAVLYARTDQETVLLRLVRQERDIGRVQIE